MNVYEMSFETNSQWNRVDSHSTKLYATERWADVLFCCFILFTRITQFQVVYNCKS